MCNSGDSVLGGDTFTQVQQHRPLCSQYHETSRRNMEKISSIFKTQLKKLLQGVSKTVHTSFSSYFWPSLAVKTKDIFSKPSSCSNGKCPYLYSKVIFCPRYYLLVKCRGKQMQILCGRFPVP